MQACQVRTQHVQFYKKCAAAHQQLLPVAAGMKLLSKVWLKGP
jgi:hypothetical protein